MCIRDSTNLVQKAAARSGGNEPDGAVGPNAVDVEQNDFDLAGAVLCGECHESILPAAFGGRSTAAGALLDNREMDQEPLSTVPRKLEPEDYYFEGPLMVFTLSLIHI